MTFHRSLLAMALATSSAVSLGVCAVPTLAAGDAAATTPPAAASFFESHVRPIIAKHCMRCHGPAKQKAGLDLRSLASLLQGSENGAVVTPGKREASLLYRLVQPDADPHMPPGSKTQLSVDDRHVLETLILRLDPNHPAASEESTTEKLPPGEDGGLALPAGLRPELAIDVLIEARWQEEGVRAAAPCDDATFVRRIYLDLVGRIPTIQERKAFLGETSSEKRRRLADRLIGSDEFARHFREVFDVVLLGRTGERRLAERQATGWNAYLERAFRDNVSWKEILRDLLVARPDSEAEQGAVQFLRERGNDHQKIAEAVARSVFGIDVACAQCHDHPIAPEIEQRHYWGLVAFFNRSENVDTKSGPRVGESAVGGFINFTTLEGENEPAKLVFFESEEIPEARPDPNAKVEDAPENYVVPPPKKGEPGERAPVPKFSRRERFFEEVVSDHPLVARALVNRLWAHFFGRGLVQPVDRIDSAHPASHPRLLRWLAEDFRQSGFDIHHLIRAIVTSRVYGLDSRPASQEGRPPRADLFARGPEKQLSAEALFRSLLVATNQKDAEKIGEMPRAEMRHRLQEMFPDLFAEEPNATLRQALFLTNSEALAALVAPREGTTTWRMLQEKTMRERIEVAFLAAFGRPPHDDELARASAYLQARAERPESGARQLLWALLTSAEFRLNH